MSDHVVPDHSVRPALDADAQAIGRIHAEALLAAIAKNHGVVDVVAANAGLTPQAVGAQWLFSITSPPSPAHIVLTALDRNSVVGFVAAAPVAVPDGSQGPEGERQPVTAEIIALEVDKDHRHQGHGSRLLNASVDVLRPKGVGRLQVWINPDDEARVRFFSGAGFAPDGRRRSFDVGSATVSEHLWFTHCDA